MFLEARAETFYDDCDRVADWCVAILRWSKSLESPRRESIITAFGIRMAAPLGRSVYLV
jgi:hypothetical protein